jgi:hypothetical protein
MANRKVGPQKEEKKEVNKWFQRVELATKFRDSDGRKSAWKNMKRYYRNFFDDKSVSVNLIFSHGRQLIPMLYFKNPVVECTGLWRGWERRAKLQEAVDNMLLQEMRVKEQLKLIIQDAYLYDYGVRKVGYDSQFGYDPTASLWKAVFAELGVTLGEEELVEFNTYVISELPFFLRVPPRRFLVDPDVEGPTLDTAEWCIEEFYRPLEDVKEDDRYTIPKELRASHFLSTDSSGNVVVSPKTQGYPKEAGTSKSDVERLKMYEIWDKRKQKVLVLADGCDAFLREQEDVWGLKNFFPYDKLSFNPISDEHYSVSDAMYVERQQLDYNDVKTQEAFHRRRANTKFLGKQGMIDPAEKDKLMSGEPMAYVETNGVPGQDVITITPSMSRDIFAGAQEIRQDFQEILAMGRNQLSQEMGKRKTASEAMIIQQYTELRSDERRDMIADFLLRVVYDVNRLIYKFKDTEDIIKLVGPEGEEWETWSGERLEGEYAIRMLPNSMLPMTKEMYRQKIERLLQIHAANPYINQKELTRLHLDSFEEFDTNKLLLQQPNTMQPMIDFRPGKGKFSEEGGGGGMEEVPNVAPQEQMGQQQAAAIGAEEGGLP